MTLTTERTHHTATPNNTPADTPPHDIAAEQAVLGGMLLDHAEARKAAAIITADDFYRPAHATIYTTIAALRRARQPADPITVAADLTARGQLARAGGTPYLHTLVAAVPSKANTAYYARIVAEQAVLRLTVEAGTRIAQLGQAAGLDLPDILQRALAAIYEPVARHDRLTGNHDREKSYDQGYAAGHAAAQADTAAAVAPLAGLLRAAVAQQQAR